MTTARRHRPKVEIVRSNLRGGRTRIVPNRQRTATEEKEETEKIVRETITIITGTEDRIKDGIMRTDVRKEDRIRNVHRIRTVRRIKSVRRIENGNPNRNVLKIRNARRNNCLLYTSDAADD